MKVYETLQNYINNGKIGDIITYAGSKICDTIFKYETYTVVSLTDGITIRRYKCRNNFKCDCFDQPVAVLTKQEFNKLDI